jgi:hypothetical protein
MKARKKINRGVEVKPNIVVEEPKEEIFPVEEKVSTKRKNKKTLLEIMEEEE